MKIAGSETNQSGGERGNEIGSGGSDDCLLLFFVLSCGKQRNGKSESDVVLTIRFTALSTCLINPKSHLCGRHNYSYLQNSPLGLKS